MPAELKRRPGNVYRRVKVIGKKAKRLGGRTSEPFLIEMVAGVRFELTTFGL